MSLSHLLLPLGMAAAFVAMIGYHIFGEAFVVAMTSGFVVALVMSLRPT